MKTTVLLAALAFGTVLSAFGQKEKKDDVYPAPVPENKERFVPASGKALDESGGFKIVNYELIWQKVFDTGASRESIEHYFRRSGIFKQVETAPAELWGFLSAFDAKGAEFSNILTPYTRSTLFSAFALVDFKEGHYRVTVKKIMIMNYYEKNNAKISYAEFAFKNNQYELKPSFLRNEAKVMDEVLTRMFSFNTTENENW
ncbi:hypothetical protein HDC92_000546 [Pedobacter sp. AK017]|uniref:hypothetical protein n=1 Tax=Pedobacter sp. AK017 TaxID=2723073 RepID=UPI00161401C3|nr:hypothetical protein [Pedobacter sp. AK017]MBB5436882.1 hypothetical protein [Pedobacter sp. AK017]